ncbi:hypothetical protein FRC02_003084 [Tulasnella sp. 418]|nr:hypothetical protein FRC02_003084 [Tulasnella sp. 418]
MSGEIKNDNKACCSIPPVQSEGYEPKGSYGPYAGLDKAYFVGPEDAENAIIFVFDIFGYYPQTLQAADILAQTLNVRVVMPDWFRGKPMDLRHFPPLTDENKKAIGDFFGDIGRTDKRLPELYAVAEQLKKDGAKKVASVGQCWGGKMNILAGATDHFVAVAAIHPAFTDPADAEKLKVPLALFPSKDDTPDQCQIQAELAKKVSPLSDYKEYLNMHHGWAAARGDLQDPENLKEYEDVYSRLATFFRNVFDA